MRLANVSRIYVESYRELECFSNLALDHVAAVVALERFHDVTCATIAGIFPGRDDGIAVLSAAITAANHFYSAMIEWLGIDPGEHYICVNVELDEDIDVDVRGAEITGGQPVDMIILRPLSCIADRDGKTEIDIFSIIKRIVWLMIYIDIHVHDKKPLQENADDSYIKHIIDTSADDVIKYTREISGSKR